MQDADSVFSYFDTFAQAGATTIAVIRDDDVGRCSLTDVEQASARTGLIVDSYDVLNRTWSVQEYADYLNSLTADTILVCSRQRICEGIKLALQFESVTYFPKGK